jgi:hypothetical protein
MRTHILTFAITASLSLMVAYGQTDTGSASSNGANTTAQPLASKKPPTAAGSVPAVMLGLDALIAHQQKTMGKAMSSSDKQQIVDAYENLEKQGIRIAPYEYLTKVIALQALPSGEVPDANAQLIQKSLEASGAISTDFALFTQMQIQTSKAKPVGRSYKEQLSLAKKELNQALKQ